MMLLKFLCILNVFGLHMTLNSFVPSIHLVMSSTCNMILIHGRVVNCYCLESQNVNHRKSYQIFFNFQIDNAALERTIKTIDLGKLFDEKLSFVSNIDYSMGKSYSMLCFRMKMGVNLNGPLVFESAMLCTCWFLSGIVARYLVSELRYSKLEDLSQFRSWLFIF